MFRTRLFTNDNRIAEFDSGYIPIGAIITVHKDGSAGRYKVINDWVSISAFIGERHTAVYQDLEVEVVTS